MKFLFNLRYVPVMLLVLMSAPAAHAAATAPSLGAAASFSVLAGLSMSAAGAGTTVSGDLGLSPGLAVSRTGPWTVGGSEYFGVGGLSQTAQADALTAFNNLAAQPSDGTMSTSTWSPTPGVYTAPLDTTFTGTITLNGDYDDVWVFQVGQDMTFSGTVIMTGNAQPCNVFWKISRDATVAIGGTFVGTLIASRDITLVSGATVNGRVISLNSSLTTDGNTISGPTCVAAPSSTPSSSPLTPPLINVRKVPSPLNLPAGPGPVTYAYKVTNPGKIPMTNITLIDDKCSNMKYVSGDTNVNSQLDISETWTYTCTTNLTQTTVNYATARGLGNGMAAVDTAIAEVFVGVPVIPPLIHILKTPSLPTLPFNGGSVSYSYAVSNPGTEALTDVTVADNKCSAVTYVSGDLNSDSMLQSNETWNYTCTTNLSLTTTNAAVATGHANGRTAIDTALATVVVEGSPIPPPLIHIVKTADPVIFPDNGGWVTYTYKVTNPGVVPLGNVSVADDKCSGVAMVSGDTNDNGFIETEESWTYTCRKYIEYTTLNTATAQGSANGLTVTDVSVAEVTVSPALIPPPAPVPPAPKLPNTGVTDGLIAWSAIAGIFVAAMLLLALTQRKRSF